MNPSVITGNETEQYNPQVQTLIQFYRAFNHADLDLMQHNWASADRNIAMSNPLGGIKLGWQAIQAVYRRIFTGEAKVYVEFYDYQLQSSADMFCVIGRERGWARDADNRQIELSIRTSRLYQRTDRQWQQVHHHGSIDNPDLLAKYQQWVKGH